MDKEYTSKNKSKKIELEDEAYMLYELLIKILKELKRWQS